MKRANTDILGYAVLAAIFIAIGYAIYASRAMQSSASPTYSAGNNRAQNASPGAPSF
jgi:hypothetical protein